ncbi:GPP34 family phosphoprotein [Streptomyces sp. NPDC005485]|uniref:GOLPH3/VPS74 family protein n=1 Tax=Streptomyces sp. NPDC005485 TaxID=3155591 RepID=UPI0033B13060
MTDALPHRMYLLAYDEAARGPYDRTRTGFLVRVAALVDLTLRGHLTEREGAVRVAEPGPVGDPVLDGVLDEVAASTHGWKHLARRNRTQTLQAVEDRLAARGQLTVEDGRIPVLSGRHTTVRDPDAVRALRAHVTAVLRAANSPQEVALEDAALVALAAAGRIGSVVSGEDRRRHRARIDALTGRLGELAPGLETAVHGMRTTMIAAQGGMGGS